MRKRARVTTVQRATRFACAGVLVVATAAGCSKVTGGAKPAASGKPATCTFVAKLDAIANTVAKADVHDPVTFDATLQTAVNDYVSNVRQLRAIAPTDLGASLQRVEADVQQLRFDAAVADRAPLDAYAARTCGRVAAAATTAPSPSAATTSVPSGSSAPTKAPTGANTTTAPSEG